MLAHNVEVRSNVDIYTYPENIAHHAEGDVVTFGDLHGNAAKFLHMLVREGVISIEKAEYNKLIEIYRRSDLKYKDKNLSYKEFEDILESAKINIPSIHLHLIGDDLADRGKNDFLQLLIYRKLSKLGLNYKIDLSNHGFEFLKQYASGFREKLVTDFKGDKAAYGASMHNLISDINAGVIEENRVVDMVKKYILPHMELLGCQVLSKDNVIVYTHAPNQPSQLIEMAKLLNIEVNTETADQLSGAVRLTNETLHRKVLAGRQAILKFINYLDNNRSAKDMFYAFFDNRYDKLSKHRDTVNRNYNTINVHGHVNIKQLKHEPVMNWRHVNVDNMLGMQHGEKENNIGSYSVFIYSQPVFRNVLRLSDQNIILPVDRDSIFSPEKKRDRDQFLDKDERHKESPRKDEPEPDDGGTKKHKF